MPIIYRHQKNAPLTSDEIDGNFEELLKRVEALEETPNPSEGIGKIEQKGDILYISGNQGTFFGQFKLPALSYNLRGRWEPNTPYALYDVVVMDAKTWVCVRAHDSVPEFEQESWKILVDVSDMLADLSIPGELPVFTEDDDLPDPEEGKVGFYIKSRKIRLIYGDGQSWRTFQDINLIEKGEENAQ
ncbi:hypothetical protein Cva_00868 [Caedimonas varicaedens]|jgi:hypothetical protein|uniref:Uncharacterized protein n=1 Tax=Caedimonas varicaedens TaxID=1629334 RepID=A0A0K8MCE1_9PROT|nr:hypothetical protein Cva_00868 [Caedimonas varicaedens]